MSNEEILYGELLQKVNTLLAVSGSHVDEKDVNRSPIQRLLNRRFYCFNLLWAFFHLLGEILWGIGGWASGTASVLELTYIIPCVTLCLIGISKSYYLVKHADAVNDLIKTLKMLQADSAKREQRIELETELKKRAVILKFILNANNVIYVVGLLMFGLGPVVVSLVMYRSTGKLVMFLPFLSYFPFDATDIRYWPIAYIHQIWTSFLAISTVHGPDSFYSCSCTFLLIQFKTLHYDITRICPENADFTKAKTRDECHMRLKEVVDRHHELIRCVNLMETIYSKGTLGNVAVSAIVMCVSAFNVTTLNYFFLKVPFLLFLILWVLQVFVLCYYSDLLVESSTEVSNAVYNSNWYTANSAFMKDLLFVLTRAQKPCKLTAMGYTDLNLRVFSKICSSAWSYFALLQTAYNNK